MNERIKELAEQAGVPKEYSFVEGATVWKTDPSIERFAELLIKKCVQVIQDEACYTGDAKVAGLDIAKEAIQKYFGVG
jgi:hypothetical protein